MIKKLLILLCLCTVEASAQQRISLAGEWNFALDAQEQLSPQSAFEDRITLPGTTDQAGYGTRSTSSDFGILTRQWKYYGKAWYSREVEIPEEWAGKTIFMELERVMWQSKLYVDGVESSMQESLGTPHTHRIGPLKPGKHHLVLSIDNSRIHNIGDKGHLYTEYTQSIWNGAVGRIELYTRPEVGFTNPQIYTFISPRSIRVSDTLTNQTGRPLKLRLTYTIHDRVSGEMIEQKSLDHEGSVIELSTELPSRIKLWDDINPNLYNLTLTLSDRKGVQIDQRTIEIGFRTVANEGNHLMVNGERVFLRGNLDCVHFPLTGYPSCLVEDWERIFRIYKDYGLNHVRFHSWTPPQAAFTAANRVGIYIQSEVLWIDWWMGVEQPDRPEMYTAGLPKGLGENPSAENFTQAELRRMVNNYGNNPSFVMMCIGNELGNSNFELMESWIKPYRMSDDRRLYASSTARRINPSDQYIATHYIDGIGATRGLRGGASTDWDFEDIYSKATIPVISHEIGQWPVYPRWSEIKKYTGTLKAMNFEEFAETARKNGIYDQNEAFVAASGALNQIMYKYEIESFLRTPSCSGIQLLSAQDYPGQGEALIGWLDAFWHSKGITTPEKFRRHHDTIVPLLRLKKFVWSAEEPFSADVQLAQWASGSLNDSICWRIEDQSHRVIGRGVIAARTYARATSDIVGRIECSLSGVTTATKFTITVSLASHDISNSWDIWVYPSSGCKVACESVYQTDRFDRQTKECLDSGGSVLLDASELGVEQTADMLSFYPLYWSLTFFPGQGKNTIGMVVQKEHPVFKGFPTDGHSNWQWQAIYKGARGFYINDFPTDYRPMAQPVDDFHRNNFVASIFELRVGRGRLLVSGFSLSDTTNLVARQLRRSILDYMSSQDFDPSYSVSSDRLSEMFRYIEPLKSELPAEFSSAALYVEAAAERTTEGDAAWNVAHDRATLADGYSYAVEADGSWRDGSGTAWHGRQITLKINLPKGVIGSLYLFFHDWNNQGRLADLSFEGRDFALGPHNEAGKWVRIHVMREDSNKGFITLRGKATKGGNLMLSKVALIPE